MFIAVIQSVCHFVILQSRPPLVIKDTVVYTVCPWEAINKTQSTFLGYFFNIKPGDSFVILESHCKGDVSASQVGTKVVNNKYRLAYQWHWR